jgi:hypothetical protein
MAHEWRGARGVAQAGTCRGTEPGRAVSGQRAVCRRSVPRRAVGTALLAAVLAVAAGCSSRGGFLEKTDASPSAAAPSVTATPLPTGTPTPVPTPTPTPRPTPPPRFGAPADGQYVYDTAKLMSSASAKKVNDAAVAFAKKYSCHIWFYTERVKLADQVTGSNAQGDATEILHEWGGSCDIVFLYLTDARDTWYSWAAETTGVYDSSDFWTQTTTKVQPFFKKGDLAGGFNTVIARFSTFLDARS